QLAARGELLTLSRYPIVGQPPVGPAADLPSDAGFAREYTATKVLRTDVAVGGRVLSAYNVHLPVQVNLELTADFLDFVADRDAARRAQLRGLDRDLDANRNPVLVAGDLNTTPAMGDLRGLRGRLRDATVAADDPYPVSWPADGPVTAWRLDWVFTSAGTVVHRYRLTDPGGLSDHRPQELLISLEEER
ncbi:MAG TPA: endonuclease/exonuclease/phosphatase family protein, partial [Micromonospora sp.]